MFDFYKSDFMGTVPLLRLPATSAETYEIGEALKVSSGSLTKCGTTDLPEFISAQAKTAGDSDVIIAARVNNATVWLVPLSAAGTSLKIGDRVPLSSSATEVTGTAGTGAAQIVEIHGTQIGDKVAVRFPDAIDVASSPGA